jgi:hypothetical protein
MSGKLDDRPKLVETAKSAQMKDRTANLSLTHTPFSADDALSGPTKTENLDRLSGIQRASGAGLGETMSV